MRTINALIINSTDWIIKVRLTKKGEEKKFNKGQQKGTLLPLEFIDEEGTQITATLFGGGIAKYSPLLIVGNCFKISDGTVRAANKRYTAIKCEIAITLDSHSLIEEIPDDETIPQNAFDFVSFKNIEQFSVGSFVDAVGVVRNISEIRPVRFRDGNDSFKRTLKLFDENGDFVDITLWRNMAEMDFTENEIIAFKNLRVGEYNKTKQFCSITDSSLIRNLKDPRVERLRAWAEENPSIRNFQTTSKARQAIMVRVIFSCRNSLK